MTKQPENKCEPDKWVEIYSDQLYRFALIRVNNKQLAEDLVQDTFVSALTKIDSFRGDSTEKTWLYTIIRNKIIDYYRSSEKKMSSKFYDLDDGTGADHFFYYDGKKTGEWLEQSAPSKFHEAADTPIEREEFMAILKYCMSKLPIKWSEVFRMKNIEELNSKEICKGLNLSSSNLWVIIHRAKLQMRECMEKKWLS